MKNNQNMMNIINLIEPTVVSNLDEKEQMGNPEFNTKDLLFVPTTAENNRFVFTMTEYAKFTGENTYRFGSTRPWDRTGNILNVRSDKCAYKKVDFKSGVLPHTRFNLEAVLKEQSQTPGFGKVSGCRIDLGYYPQSKVENSKELDCLFRLNPEKFVATGKTYTTFELRTNRPVKNIEYNYQGNLYVRAGHRWFNVEPISWDIQNWCEMPKSINPNGNGTAKFIDAAASTTLLKAPFYVNDLDQNRHMYQNSTVRAYLNGIDVCNIKANGNPKFAAPNGGNFTNSGFLQEAFIFSKDLLEQNITVENNQENKKLTKCILSSKDWLALKNLNSDVCRQSLQEKLPEIDIEKIYADLQKIADTVNEDKTI